MANVPSTFTEAQIVETVRGALQPWTQLATASIPLSLGKVIHDTTKTRPQADGANVIFWEAGSTPKGDMFAGKAYPFASECDILLEPRAPFTLIDVKAIVMHEVGHCLGLAHSTAHSVMTKFQGLPSIGYDDTVAMSLTFPPAKAPSITSSTATLKGRVTRKGKPLLGAVLRVADRSTQRIVVAGFSGLVDAQQRVDSAGRFELPGLPPQGRYVLRVEPMDAFAAADPPGYGSPTEKAPEAFTPLSIELPALEAGGVHDVGTLALQDH